MLSSTGSATHFWDGITFLITVNMMPPRDMLFWGNGVPARRIQALNSSPAHASNVRHYLHERHLLPATRLHPKQHVANGRASAQWSAVRVKYRMGRSILRSGVEALARASFPAYWSAVGAPAAVPVLLAPRRGRPGQCAPISQRTRFFRTFKFKIVRNIIT